MTQLSRSLVSKTVDEAEALLQMKLDIKERVGRYESLIGRKNIDQIVEAQLLAMDQ